MRRLPLLVFTAAMAALSVKGQAPGQLMGPAPATSVAAVNSSITISSLAAQAICALHTDTGCLNSTNATQANCTAGTLTAACTLPTSLTIPANTLGGNISELILNFGSLATATVPTSLVEIYLDSTRVYVNANVASATGSRASSFLCTLATLGSGATAPLAMSCTANGNLGGSATNFGSNGTNNNTVPAVAIDTTVSHVLKVSISYSAATTGNMTWLYGMRFNP